VKGGISEIPTFSFLLSPLFLLITVLN